MIACRAVPSFFTMLLMVRLAGELSIACMLNPMRWSLFFRRREVWIPTLRGWLLALLIGTGACIWVIRHVHDFLAPDQPVGARLLVIEGWMAPDQLDQAADRIRRGHYDLVITTGGPAPVDLYRPEPVPYAELARDYLVRTGIAGSLVAAVSVPESAQDRTYLSAVMVREWLEKSGHRVDALDVFSSGVHGRRTRMMYQLTFGPQTRIGITGARPTGYDPESWWTTSTGAKTVIAETMSWIWTVLFFRPSVRGSHEEKWGTPPPATLS